MIDSTSSPSALLEVRGVGLKILTLWISLVVQWLRIPTSNVGGMGSIPGQESFVVQPKKKEKKENSNPLITGLALLAASPHPS